MIPPPTNVLRVSPGNDKTEESASIKGSQLRSCFFTKKNIYLMSNIMYAKILSHGCKLMRFNRSQDKF